MGKITLEAVEEERVIQDFESVRIVGPGKFEIDVVNVFRKERPIVYKLEEGTYIVDLAMTFKQQEQNKK